MALDYRRISFAALDHVGINRSLHEHVDLAQLLCLILKYADKFLADDLSLLLRLSNTCKL